LIESNNIIIPNVNNLTIQGNSSRRSTIFDARNIESPNLRDPRYVGVFSRSTEDRRRMQSLDSVNNLIIRNMSFIGNQTGAGYLADDLSIDGLRINNVNNLLIENISTNSVGLSIECRNINRGLIRNCYSFNDAAAPLSQTTAKMLLLRTVIHLALTMTPLHVLAIYQLQAPLFLKTVCLTKDSKLHLQ
jgi:hypothetical protein